MYNPQVIIDKMNSWLGCKQGDATHKHIVDTYNAHKPLAGGYKVKYTDAWCATTVSAAAIECGYTDIIPTECSCNRMITKLKDMGIWEENDAFVPQTGDIIFYDWQDSGIGDNVGSSDHVGYVEKVDNGIITVIEGNKSNGVGKRTIPVNGKYIRGYGVPKYDMASAPVPATPVNPILKGVDLSSNQGAVDFKKIKASGIEFAILRSTLKNGNSDPRFEQYYAQATEVGIPVSVYKYSYADTPAQSFNEAVSVVKLLNGRLCTIWLDVEDSAQIKKIGKAGLTNIINAFMDYCIASGYDVGIYCNLNWYKNYISADLKKKYKFWIARYGKNNGTLDEKYRPNVGEAIWQYTSKGVVNGISGFVDLDIRQ